MGIAFIVVIGLFLVAAAYGFDVLPSLLVFLGPALFLVVGVGLIVVGVANRRRPARPFKRR